jgi:hypothetical protein
MLSLNHCAGRNAGPALRECKHSLKMTHEARYLLQRAAPFNSRIDMEDLNELTDLFLQCKTCHEYFVFDVFEQAYFAERGLHQTKRCKQCRNGNKGNEKSTEYADYGDLC